MSRRNTYAKPTGLIQQPPESWENDTWEAAHSRQIAELEKYYAETQRDYFKVWLDDRNLALHFGYWDEQTQDHPHSLIRMNEVMADLVDITAQDRVLDAGCGMGGAAMWLAETFGATVTGITVSSEQLDRARSFCADRQLQAFCNFERQDFCATSFPDDSFDVVWTQESITQTLAKRRFLREAFRILKPGGRLVEEEVFRGDTSSRRAELLFRQVREGYFIPPLWSVAEYREAAEREGFINFTSSDITRRVEPSLRRLNRYTMVYYPFARVRRRRNSTSDTRMANLWSARNQWRTYRHGLWHFAIVAAVKPSTARTEEVTNQR